jgi:thiamine biosynthesis lipoprotein
MGSRASFLIVGGTDHLLDEAIEVARECERRWSRFLPDSDVTRLNWAEGAPVEVSALTVRLIEEMISGVELTDGDFDPTLLPNVLAAGYTASFVDPSRVTTVPDSARSPGDVVAARIDGTTVTLPLGTTLDPGGIGKGLAADLVCDFAMSNGAWGMLAEIGGDIVVAGQAPEGVAWSLGVENPFVEGEHSSFVRIGQGALATSSQRERRFDHPEGEKHHLIDPRTESSAATSVQTVSVIASTGARAESLTKPGFMRDTIGYLEWLPTVGAAGLVIDASGAVTASGNWSNYR